MRLPRNVKDIKRVVQDSFWFELQQPFVGIGIRKQLSGEIGGAHHDNSAGALGRLQRLITNTVGGGINSAEIREVDLLIGMRILICFQSNQSLSPIRVAIGEQVVTLRLLD